MLTYRYPLLYHPMARIKLDNESIVGDLLFVDVGMLSWQEAVAQIGIWAKDFHLLSAWIDVHGKTVTDRRYLFGKENNEEADRRNAEARRRLAEERNSSVTHESASDEEVLSGLSD